MGLERGPLSLVSTIEELLERKSSGSGLINREYDNRDPSRLPRGIPLSAKVGTKFADKRRSLGIVRSRTQTTEFALFFCSVCSLFTGICVEQGTSPLLSRIRERQQRGTLSGGKAAGA
jgi:hypothetical protein